MLRIDLDRWEEILLTITRNKTRSLLTAFGVFWGIFMLIALMGGGQGLQDLMSANFQGFATNSAFLGSNRTSEAYKGFRKGRIWNLDTDDLERIRQAVPELQVVTPNNGRWGATAYYSDFKADCFVRGLYPEYEAIEAQKLTWGRFINPVDILEQRKVCVIGKQIYERLFPQGGNPCGQFLRVDGIYYCIIGVSLSTSNININGSTEESVTLPFTTMQQAYKQGKRIDLVCVTARPGYRISDLTTRIEQAVKQAHYIHPDDKQAIIMVNAEAMFSMIDNLFSGIRILTWMVGLGTLLAGAIGVSNIMMVTVKERTTEIGIRRAIGARPQDILHQILSESMVLTTLAGMMGICFGVAILQGVETLITATSDTTAHFQISFWMAVGACLLLLMLGMLAGLAPAYRAMAIRPIEAIRDE